MKNYLTLESPQTRLTQATRVKGQVFILSLFAVIAFSVFAFHALIFSTWIVDDAGIMFAYARNIAQGHGIVSQPGVAPVEGCSDFLWMMLFVPFFWLKIFDPVLTPKIFSACIVLVLFFYALFTLRHHLPSYLGFIFLLLLSIASPFVIWSIAGLENPLYVSLLFVYFSFTMKAFEEGKRRDYLVAGVMAFLVAITRPEGIMYGFVLPVLFMFFRLMKPEQLPGKVIITRLLVYFAVWGFLYGAFLIFRNAYFGEWVPNTYYFKGGPDSDDLTDILILRPAKVMKLEELFSAVVFKHSFLAIFLFVVINCRIYFTGRYSLFHLVVTVFFLFTVAGYLLLPYDGMGEFRFGTPFILFFYLFLISTLYHLFRGFQFQGGLTALLLLVLISVSANDFYKRSVKYAENPWVPFRLIREVRAVKFNNYADKLNLRNASLLTPDCGATLYYSKLRVFDMAGLIDKRYALTTIGKNNKAFNDLVLEEDRPTFIEIHTDWAYHSTLQQDPRFLRDYVPINEARQNVYGREVVSGEYIRKEAIGNNVSLLETLK